MDHLTFGLAFAAYVLLAADVAARAWGIRKRGLTFILAVVLTAHVALVWGHRFGWSIEWALAKGWTGFVVFHAAYAAIVAAAVAREPWATRLLFAAFPVASAGAIGAAFKYDYVNGLRFPLLAVLAIAIVAAGLGWKRRLNDSAA
ncbi:MAG TPA: hypothetical protein VFS19_03840 [Planctomycetota bacterium]|nr:hypothetical protein [Planctomycetota bacterium]